MGQVSTLIIARSNSRAHTFTRLKFYSKLAPQMEAGNPAGGVGDCPSNYWVCPDDEHCCPDSTNCCGSDGNCYEYKCGNECSSAPCDADDDGGLICSCECSNGQTQKQEVSSCDECTGLCEIECIGTAEKAKCGESGSPTEISTFPIMVMASLLIFGVIWSHASSLE